MADTELPLAGRAALVTGASRRIGRAIALHLARDGAAVLVNARSSGAEAEAVAKEIAHAGGKAIAHLANVADEAEVQAMVAAAVDAFGGLDIVAHNAVSRPTGTIEDMTLDAWHDGLGVMLDGAFLLAKHAAPHLKKGGRGRIVLIGGTQAFEGGLNPVVPTGKAGLVGMVKSLARSLGPAGGTANVLSIGTVVDEANDSAERLEFHRTSRPVERIPLGRHGTPDDIGALAAAMCGRGFDYVTGQVVHATGGYYMG